MPRIGLDCIAYRNTGTWNSPTWNECVNVRDITQNLSKGEADTSRRSSDWRKRKGTLRDASIDITIIQVDSDADFAALRNAYLNGTTIDMALMDRNIETAGAEGLRAPFEVMSMTRNEALEDAVAYDFSLMPGDDADGNEPEWMIVGS